MPNLSWITDNLDDFLIGTELPDFGIPTFLKSLKLGLGYKDAIHCHCILFDVMGKVTNDRAAMRVQEEFDKAKEALENNKPRLAAFYAGAMAHYIGDLSQFMHIMGKQSHWGSEDQKIHHTYEVAADRRIDNQERTSLLYESYVHKKSVPGSDARAVTTSVARFTETGGDTIHTTGWMYKTYKGYYKKAKASKPQAWSKEFLDQSGENINTSINGVAKLLVKLSK